MTSPAETYLRDFHRRLPGVTSREFGGAPVWRDGEVHPSSYSLLEAEVPRGEAPLVVLDLACGDGHLLELLARRQQPGLSLLGVDLSEHELAAARTRLKDAATLTHGRAQSLPYPEASVDLVLSHLAFMLMDDVETVLSELRRVLKPTGRVSMVIGGGPLRNEAFEQYVRLLRPVLATTPNAALPLGDPRVRTSEGLAELFRDFTGLHIQNLEVQGDGPPERVWDSLTRTYDADRLPESARDSLKADFLRAVEPLRLADGTLPFRWSMRQVTATRP
ncbi:class I SAM-dependent methyltransferase [Myxococcus stipitatus]|uniref:class I SAM-dependent methyltransferase n=1 Tax=Myxococcus stipitatus TaxID=83455 RepID=UPI003144D5E1